MAEHAINQSDDAGKGTLEVGNILGGEGNIFPLGTLWR